MMSRSPKTQSRWPVPQNHGEILLIPSLGECCRQALEAARHRGARAASLGDAELAASLEEARGEFLQAATEWTRQYSHPERSVDSFSGPIVLTGHQPELFHPGVWLKNFVAAHIAENIGGIAVNVLIDNDRFKNSSVWVLGGSRERPVLESIPLDRDGRDLPYEMRRVNDWELVTSFKERALQSLSPWVAQPLLVTYWPRVLSQLEKEQRLGHALAQARNQLEISWGVRILDIPLGLVADLRAHRLFLAFVLRELPRVVQVYNHSLDRYRQAHRIRNKAQPLPNLESAGSWQEVPYWVWTENDPARRRLFARKEAGTIHLTDLHGWEVKVPEPQGKGLTNLAKALHDLRQQGVYLRPRALMTTLFLRLVIGDYFVHGIGGARYDEVTNGIIEQLFGIESPPFAVATGTLWLARPEGTNFAEALRQTKQLLRDVTFHPERFFLDCSAAGWKVRLSDPRAQMEVSELIQSKYRWIATPKTPENPRQRHQAIVQANQRLRNFLVDLESELKSRFSRLQELEYHDRILRFREFPFCFFPEKVLRDFFAQATCEVGRQPV